jgi:hypothetical protein
LPKAFFFGGEMKHVGHYIIGSVFKGRYIFVTNGQGFGVTWPRRVMSYGAGRVIIL